MKIPAALLNFYPHSAISQVLKMACPLIGLKILNVLAMFFGVMMIAQLGSTQLAASTLAISFFTTFNILTWSLLLSLNNLIAEAYGANKKDIVAKIFVQSLLLSTILGILFIILLVNSSYFFQLFKLNPELTLIAKNYFIYITYGIPPGLWLVCWQQLLSALEQQKLLFYWNIAVLGTMQVLAYLFIFGKYGFPALGISGLALAISISNWLNLLGLMFIVMKSKKISAYAFLKMNNFTAVKYQLEILKSGWSISIQYSTEFLAFTVITFFMAWFGNYILVIQQITNQFFLLMFMIPAGIAQACTILTSQAVGKNALQDINTIARAGLILGFIFMILSLVIVIVFAKQISNFYLSDIELNTSDQLHILYLFFTIGVLAQGFDALKMILIGVLRGIKDFQTPALLGISLLWLIGVLGGLITTFYLQLGAIGLRLGLLLAFIITTLVLLLRLNKKIRIHSIKTINKKSISHKKLRIFY